MHNGTVPGAHAFREHVEVVSVQMHGVGGAGVVFDDDPHAVVVAEVVDVPLLTIVSIRTVDQFAGEGKGTYGIKGVGSVAEIGKQQDGVANHPVSDHVCQQWES